MKEKHVKHAKLTRPAYGEYSRNEWAILGTPCGEIQKLASQLTAMLKDEYKIAYVDADHKSADADADLPGALTDGANFEYTDKIDFHQLNFHSELTPFKKRSLFNDQDLVLVNGNHFKAKNQIVVIDERKLESLGRKLDRLTNIDLILFRNNPGEIPEFLKKHIGQTSVPQLPFNDIEKIADVLRTKMHNTKAPLYSLVLAGGKSQRMGKDKGALKYHGKEQREHVADMLSQLTEKTFLSGRGGQEMISKYPIIEDQFVGLGPFGAILTAFMTHPDAAWLVTACDLPFLNKEGIQQLIESRNSSKAGTAFHNEATNFPDPLCTIWEPRSYPVLMQFLTQGYSCPRKVLINSDVEIVQPNDPNILKNVNTPEEFDKALSQLKTN